MRALITGAAGQDGRYLTDLLTAKGYTVYRLYRRHEGRVLEPHPLCIDIVCDAASASRLPQVDEIYNLAAQSHVGHSFKNPRETISNNIDICINMLEWARVCNARFYQASTSEIFGNQGGLLTEDSPHAPRSPYGVSKKACHDLVNNYREAHNLRAFNGILFNHESPLRGSDFVTQKVCTAAANKEKVTLGNLAARRDWGHARDHVQAMWMMMNRGKPGDYVVATGKTHSVEDLCRIAYGHMGLDWQEYVQTSADFLRPSEIDSLCGHPAKIKELGWAPGVGFGELIMEMVNHAAPTP